MTNLGLKHRFNYESATNELKNSEKHYLESKYAGSLNAALVYPNLYSLGMSNLGYLTVHRLLSSLPNTGVERFFPALQPEVPLNAPYYSFETGRPLGDFNILMFSFSFEGDFDKIPGIFASLGIPVLAKNRNKHHPLMVAGGAAIASNPQALSLVFDVIIPNEAETTIVPLIETLHKKGFDKEALASIKGLWVPSLTSEIPTLCNMHDVNSQPAYSHIVSEKNSFGGAHMIEVMRGCPRVCSFCLARCIYAPPRPVSAAVVENWLNQHPDCKDLGLVAPSLFDHPEVEQIFTMLLERGIRVRNSSVKWEKISPTIIKCLQDSGITGITIAPETGSQRMRKAMRKPMNENLFLDRVKELFNRGFQHIKMYFVTSLPEEKDEDTAATVDFIHRVVSAAPSISSLSATFSIFVPKKHTFWENEQVENQYSMKRKIKYLKEALGKIGSFKANFESPQEALRQAYLSKVGAELGEEYSRLATEERENRLFSKGQFTAIDF